MTKNGKFPYKVLSKSNKVSSIEKSTFHMFKMNSNDKDVRDRFYVSLKDRKFRDLGFTKVWLILKK